MTEAVKISEKDFFINYKLNRVQIRCDEKNKAAAAVAKRCGYKLYAILRENKYVNYYKSFRNTLVF